MFKKTRSQTRQTVPLSEHPDRPVGMYEEAIGQFAEIYGSAKVGETHNFLLALVVSVVAAIAVVALWTVSQRSVAVPWLVEVNPGTGEVQKPVRIENVRPSEAVIKAEIGRWAAKVLTIDQVLTPVYFREAVVMTKGAGDAQFSEFRVSQKIVERMAQDKYLQRRATVTGVDITQPGVAFVFATTKESRGQAGVASSSRFRMSLKYELVPPKTESELLANPLGLYIVSMDATEESATR